MKLTFLGTGTSIGVPEVGCRCPVCTSSDARDSRLRCSSLVESARARILIDCSNDFRQQMLRLPYDRLDAVLITHRHFDHTGGIDDLRPFCRFGGDIHLYMDHGTAADLRQRLPYFFAEKLYPGVARLVIHEVTPGMTFRVGDITVEPMQVMHGALPILGYRLTPDRGPSLGYITDMSTCPDVTVQTLCGTTESTAAAGGVDTLVVNALRKEPHPSHQCLNEAIAFCRKVGARQNYLIHFSHGIGLHAATDATLPRGIHLAYDGLEIEI